MKLRTHLRSSTRGAALVEYAVLMAFLSVGVMVTVWHVGSEARDSFEIGQDGVREVADRINASQPGAGSGGNGGGTGSGGNGGGTEAPGTTFPPNQVINFDSYPDPGTEIGTVNTGGIPIDRFEIEPGYGLEISDGGVIRIVDRVDFGLPGSTQQVEIIGYTPDGTPISTTIGMNRRDASAQNQWWDVKYAYDRITESGTSYSATAGSNFATQRAIDCENSVNQFNGSAPAGTSYYKVESTDAYWYRCTIMQRYVVERLGPEAWPFQNVSGSTAEDWYMAEFEGIEGTNYGITNENFRILSGPFRINAPW